MDWLGHAGLGDSLDLTSGALLGSVSWLMERARGTAGSASIGWAAVVHGKGLFACEIECVWKCPWCGFVAFVISVSKLDGECSAAGCCEVTPSFSLETQGKRLSGLECQLA